MSETSATPRTDAIRGWQTPGSSIDLQKAWDLCAQLERELAMQTHIRNWLQTVLRKYVDEKMGVKGDTPNATTRRP